MENVNTTVAAADNTAPAAEPVKKVFAIHPDAALLREVDAADPKRQAMIEGLQSIYAQRNEDGTRKCGVIELANGDRVITAPGAIGPIDTAEKRMKSVVMGQFAVLKNPVTLEDVQTAQASGQPVEVTSGVDEMTEVLGPALVVGPDDGTDVFTAAASTKEALSGTIAWHSNAAQRSVADMLASLLGRRSSTDERDDLSNEQLEECGCPGCQEELEARQNRLH